MVIIDMTIPLTIDLTQVIMDLTGQRRNMVTMASKWRFAISLAFLSDCAEGQRSR